MSEFANCMYKLRAEGKPYPRTCAECGLFGPCKAGLRPEREAAAASARPLPPLPEPDPLCLPTGWVRYTADQMHAYASSAKSTACASCRSPRKTQEKSSD